MDMTGELAQALYEIASGLKLAAYALQGLCFGEENEAEAQECFTSSQKVERLASSIAFNWSRAEQIDESVALMAGCIAAMAVGRIALGLKTAAKATIRLSGGDDISEYAEPLERIAKQATALAFDLRERRILKNKE